VWPPLGAVDTVFPRPRAIIQLAMAVDSACTNRLPSLKFVCDTLSVSALIGRVTLTFNLLTSNLVRIIARRVGNLAISFGISETFCS